MSRKGNSLENLPMKNFFEIMKREMFYKYEHEFQTIDQLKTIIEVYIMYDNTQGITTKIKEMAPVQYRNQPL